jgi:iron complex transport system permease protein
MRINRTLLFSALTALLVASFLCSVGLGAMSISPSEVLTIIGYKLGLVDDLGIDAAQMHVLWNIRLPRTLAGVLVGAGLAIAGASLQGLFRNPLADPALVGISSGASLAAATAIILGITSSSFGSVIVGNSVLNLVTFAGAVITAFIVYRISTSNGKTQISTMLLAGVAINALAMSGVGFMTYIASENELRDITFWMLGSLGGVSWSSLAIVFPAITLTLIFLPKMARGLNSFTLGEQNASYIGANTHRLKLMTILLSTLAVGVAVAISGVIGFVGLVVPHVVRMIAGPDHRTLLPASALAGALLLVLADLMSRMLLAPAELPIGILTALIGTPLFLSILIREKRKFEFS